MVQEKDAARNRVEVRKNWLTEELDRMDRENPVVATKWAVEEVTPAYNTGGYYDQDIPEESKIVSPKYDTEKEAKDWMDRHEADKGKFLAVVQFTAREMKHINWSKARMRY